MRLELEAAREQPLEWSEEVALDDESLRQAGVRILGAVACSGTVFHSPPDFIVRGEVRYRQRLQCFRCMEAFESQVASEFDLVVQIAGQADPGDEIELHESDLDLLSLEEPILVTEPVATEQIHLQLPMKPLCQDDCKGLCSECGSNRNQADCSCAEAPADSRFAGLADLKAKLEK